MFALKILKGLPGFASGEKEKKLKEEII